MTGLELETGEMMEKAAAGWELYRELNAREGLGSEMDIPPEAWFSDQPLWGRGGSLRDYFGNELYREDILTLLDDYYDERGRKTSIKETIERRRRFERQGIHARGAGGSPRRG